MDASGLGTYFRVVLGEQVLLPALDDAMPLANGWDVETLVHQAALLEEGDDL